MSNCLATKRVSDLAVPAVDRFLTSHNIYGFENQLKTGAVLVDLTAAYDPVTHKALLFKVAKVVKKCKSSKFWNLCLTTDGISLR